MVSSQLLKGITIISVSNEKEPGLYRERNMILRLYLDSVFQYLCTDFANGNQENKNSFTST